MRLRSGALTALAAAALVGLAAGLWNGFLDVDANRYLEHGMHRNALRALEDGVLPSLLVCLGLAAFACAVTWAAEGLRAPAARRAARPLAVVAAAWVLVLALHVPAPRASTDTALALSLLAAIPVAVALAEWLYARFGDARALVALGLGATLLVGVAHRALLIFRSDAVCSLDGGAALPRGAALGALGGVALLAGLGAGALRGRHPSRRAWRAPATLAVCVALPLAGHLALERPPLAPGPAFRGTEPRNVLLVAVDTLRADHTSVAGREPPRPTTPNLARLAGRGRRYEYAIAQAPWTLPSFSSVVTGLYPREHGADGFGKVLGASNTTLAEILYEAGYSTSGIVSHVFVGRNVCFQQGFAHFEDELKEAGHEGRTSDAVTDRALARLRARGDRPFFLLVHYFDPHYEWLDRADWRWTEGYTGWLEGWTSDIWSLRTQRHRLTDPDLRYLEARYDEEVAATDRAIGRLLDFLDREGLREDTLVAVVADHGEEFMEHGWLGHTISLRDEVIRVPLVLAGPGTEEPGAAVETPVETRALFWTVLARLGIPWEEESPHRRRLPSEDDAERLAFSSVWLGDGGGKRAEMVSVRSTTGGLLLDLTRDLREVLPPPGERSAASGPTTGALDAELADWLRRTAAGARASPDRGLSEEEIEQLKALGYL